MSILDNRDDCAQLTLKHLRLAIVFIHDGGVGWLELSTRRIEITGSSPTIIIDSSSCRSSSCRALTC